MTSPQNLTRQNENMKLAQILRTRGQNTQPDWILHTLSSLSAASPKTPEEMAKRLHSLQKALGLNMLVYHDPEDIIRISREGEVLTKITHDKENGFEMSHTPNVSIENNPMQKTIELLTKTLTEMGDERSV